MAEIKTLRKTYNPSATAPKEYQARTIAILYNKDNEWNSNEGKQTLQWSYGAHLAKYYKAIIAQTIPVDFISEARDFSAYKVMLLPAYQLVDDELVAKLNQYVHQGGNLILSVRSGTKDRNGKIFEAKWGAKLTPLIGAQISMFDVLPEDMYAQVALNNRLYPWNNWADILKPAAATQVWANYNDQFYKGAAVVTHRTLGKGTVTYIGVDSDDGQIEKEIIGKLYQSVGLTTERLPEGVIKIWRSGFGWRLITAVLRQKLNLPKMPS